MQKSHTILIFLKEILDKESDINIALIIQK